MKNKCLIIFAACMFLHTGFCFAQPEQKGIPVSLQDGFFPNKFKNNIPTIDMPFIDNESLQQETDSICTDCKKNYYGLLMDNSINIKQSARKTILKDSSKVWLLKIESPTAYAMQFYFSRFKLPEGATLYVFNEDASMIWGIPATTIRQITLCLFI